MLLSCSCALTQELKIMNTSLLHEAAETLQDLKRMRKRLSGQIDSLRYYRGWILKKGRNRQSSRTYYDAIRPNTSRKKYLGNDRNEQVLNIKRFRYAQEALNVIDSDIALLENLLSEYIVPEYQNINRRLPATYRTDLSKTVSPKAVLSSLPKESILWKQRLEAEKAKYPPYKPEQLKHQAMDGSMMRSKSEVIIANIMFLAGIPYVYEVPLFIKGQMLLPDFTILSLIDLKTEIIIEHQGMVFLEEYATKFIRSLRTYLQSDFWIPNENLFFTYDDARETLNPHQVMSILKKFVKPSIDMSLVNVA